MNTAGEDRLAAPPSPIAEESLRRILDMSMNGASLDAVRADAEVALAQIDMHRRLRAGRDRRRTWLAKVTSFAFPRTFSTGPLPKTGDINILMQAGRRHHHVCFTVQITDGSKNAVGREVEVQLPADEAMKLGQKMVRIATALLPAPREGEQNSPSKGDRVT